MFKIKRIYEDESPEDGVRILVDRIWPRGISKERADLLEWDKNTAPGTELRKWFNHEPEKFAEFSKRYIEELKNDPDAIKAVDHLKELGKKGTVTLLYAAKDPKINQAVVLLDYLNS